MVTSYAIAHLLRDRMPFCWKQIERTNAVVFRCCYARKLKQVEQEAFEMALPFIMERISDLPTMDLVEFFHAQPAETYRWFTPHGFSEEDVAKLQNNKSFLGYVLKRDGKIVGYFFLRSYFNGSCYFGRLVDHQSINQGVGTLINKLSFFISESLHMRSYQTIAGNNIASIKSCAKAYRLRPIGITATGDTLYQNCRL